MTYRIGLVGNPNSGKTTIFNALTGAKQRVGNWPGVTVERKVGQIECDGHHIEVTDIPGTYSLIAFDQEGAIDERIACQFITSGQADVIVNVIDAANLERNLYLTAQLLEMRIPMVIAVNMIDVAKQRRQAIDIEQLQQRLDCPVVVLSAKKKQGMHQLRQAICQQLKNQSVANAQCAYPKLIQQAIIDLTPELGVEQDNSRVLRILEGDSFAHHQLNSVQKKALTQWQARIEQETQEECDILIADARYQYVHQLARQVVTQPDKRKNTFSDALDKWLLNRFLGIPIFFAVMYSMFLFAINIGGAFQDFFNLSSEAIFVKGSAHLLTHWHLPDWLIALVAGGVGKGINVTLTFIPVIGAMFLFLSFLEASGYMARAAFVMDRFMRALGLPGKSFVPMIVGFGCNVPAIMAARTLENRRDRILTIIMSPFMSCGARLAIFAVFAAAFFPQGGQNIVFALYLIGILTAVLTGLVLRKTILQGKPAPFILELPPYHWPSFNNIWRQTWMRLQGFVTRAGKVIIPVCILLGTLNALTISGGISFEPASENSLLSQMGRWLTPVFAPMGITQDNWPATVGLLTGTLAKEVVIGTLDTLYTQMGQVSVTGVEQFNLWADLQAALISVPENLAAVPQALFNPVVASSPAQSVDDHVYGLMYSAFGGPVAAFSYLLFVLLYVPCISTTAVMRKELNARWMWFSVAWSFGLAYLVAVMFYQFATVTLHPFSSICWIVGLLNVLALTLLMMRQYAKKGVHNLAQIPIRVEQV